MLLAAGVLWWWSGAGDVALPDEPVADAVAGSSPTSGYTALGHQDDVLRGAAFSEPREDPMLVPEGWAQLPVSHPAEAGEVDLTVSLDQQLYDMLLEDVQAFARERGVRIAVNRGTCGVSAAQLGRKEADVGGFCCPPGATDRLPGLRYHTIGIGAIALLVHPDNPIDDISRDQAQQVFRWQLRRWSELPGGESFDKPVTPVVRLHCKTRPGHWSLLLGDESLFSPVAQDVGEIGIMLDQVARYRDAIGYETLFWARRGGKPVKPLRIDGVAPSDLTGLAVGAYPFYRTFNLTTWHGAAAKPLAQALVEHLAAVVERDGARHGVAPASTLRRHGWRFHDDELVGEPPARGPGQGSVSDTAGG